MTNYYFRNLYFLIMIAASAFSPFLIHIFLVRILGLFKNPFLRQKGAVLSCTCGYIFTSILFVYFEKYADLKNSAQLFYSGFYLFFVYTIFTYVYFHIFNLSETARRIKMLMECEKSSGLTKEQLLDKYSYGDMISNRLKRLLALGILKTSDGKYITAAKTLLYIAKLAFSFRKVIFPKIP